MLILACRWLFVPRACVVFYVPKKNQHILRTALPTSHGFEPLPREDRPNKIFSPLPMEGKSPFILLFNHVATLDVSTYLCIGEALKFRKEACGGENKIMDHCRQISDEAGKRAADIFGTEIMENEQGSLNRSAFSNVRLPLKMGTNKGEVPERDAITAVSWIAQRLIQEYDTYAAVYSHARAFWTRFTGQVYLEMADFEKGIKAMNELCERVRAGEYRRGYSKSI